MERELFANLRAWRDQEPHLPIVLRGARQVGKSFLVQDFGKRCFANLITINFEESPEYISCFDTLKPQEIRMKIEVLCRQSIVPGETLLFLDEIQACPNAIMALRYFKEQCPQLHVIAAGSLLEFALQEKGMRMPVGRVHYLYLKQLSFREYLSVSGHEKLIQYLNQVDVTGGVADAIHQQALKLVHEYTTLGGMPMVVASYLKNHSLQECQQYQTSILRAYSDDFAKYSSTARHKYLQKVFNQVPGLVGQQVKYVAIAPDMDSRYLKEAILDLNKAGVVYPIYSTSAAGLPFVTHSNEKKFKLLFIDIGLLKRASKLDIELLFAEDIMLLNRGAIAEQFVGQELLAYQDPYDEPALFYWSREAKSSMAEVDYLINVGSRIVPVEVKSGKTGNLKSLHSVMQENKLSLGIRISAKPLAIKDGILSVPFYMISQISRLIRAAEDTVR